MKDIRKIENLHVALWLLKDTAWCSSWKTLGMVMILPTLVVSLKIAWETRREPEDFIHNLVVCLWICANMTWMAGEFFWNDGTRSYAKLFFFSGLALLLVFYGGRAFKKICGRMRVAQMDRAVSS